MLENVRVTPFSVSELLKENHHVAGGGGGDNPFQYFYFSFKATKNIGAYHIGTNLLTLFQYNRDLRHQRVKHGEGFPDTIESKRWYVSVKENQGKNEKVSVFIALLICFIY